MTLQNGTQPEIRFSKVGPNSLAGISYVEKSFAFKKHDIAGTSADDFFVAPAGIFITKAVMRCEVALDGSGTVALGQDGDPDSLVTTTDFDVSTTGAFGSNIGSTLAVGAIGLYLNAGDTLRLTVGGTPTVGAVSGVLSYFEMEAIESRGYHFDLS